MSRDQQRSSDRELINAGFRYAISLAHNQHDAEDLIQQACLKVLRRHGNLVGKGYLFTAVRNLFFDQKRKRRHPDETRPPESILDESPDHALAVDRKLDMEQLLGCLRPEEREALFLNCVEGYTAEEIGALTNQPRGTVLSLLSRAKNRLARRHASSQVMDSK